MLCPIDILLRKGKKAYRSPYWICREFPKADRIGYSFLVLLGCPSRRYDLGTTRRDPGLVWSRATLTIENIREGSSVIRQFVALSFVACDRHYPRCLTIAFGLTEFRIVCIPAFIERVWQVCLETVCRGGDNVAVVPTGFMESHIYFNCGYRCRAAKFYSEVIVIYQSCFSFE